MNARIYFLTPTIWITSLIIMRVTGSVDYLELKNFNEITTRDIFSFVNSWN